MVQNDTIAMALSQIKNAQRRALGEAKISPFTKSLLDILKILKEEKYILDFKEEEQNQAKYVLVKLSNGVGIACFPDGAPAGKMELELFASDHDRSMLATVYSAAAPPPGFGENLRSALPILESVCWRERTQRRETVWGSGGLTYRIGEFHFRVGHDVFFQANRFLHEAMIQAALQDLPRLDQPPACRVVIYPAGRLPAILRGGVGAGGEIGLAENEAGIHSVGDAARDVIYQDAAVAAVGREEPPVRHVME